MQPFAFIYKAVAYLRVRFTSPKKLKVPAICVGNIVMGGAGKTPTTMALATALIEKGLSPHILSRGYGGSITTSTLVDVGSHQAQQVGDEPLLLARIAPTWIGHNRFESGQMAIAAGADVVILDDGLQNPTLKKDLSFLVIDGRQGLGNGYIFPAGPLRESLSQGLEKTDAVIFIGEDIQNLSSQITKPIIRTAIEYKNPSPKRVFAFSALGFPEKFYGSLNELGYEVVDQQSFADHHPYTDIEIVNLMSRAKALEARLITTEKDLLKIPSRYHTEMDVLHIQLRFKNSQTLENLFKAIIK